MIVEELCGKMVKTLRDHLKLSQQAFGTLFGFSIMSVSRWERGQPIRERFSIAVLELAESALATHPPEAVLSALRNAGAKPSDLFRTLVWLELNPPRYPLPGTARGGSPPSSGDEPGVRRRR